ncbi:MAG: PQQ-like beta-propeller repeat protein [Bryobacterales bacterium]|nr:PQQ-like beta-propeller repeat protein [Bryobacterales bacterium]
MPITANERHSERPIRLWPGVAAVTLGFGSVAVLAALAPESSILGVLGAVAGGLIVFLWWAFFSHIPHPERWGGLLLGAAVLAIPPRIPGLMHASILGGMQNRMYFMLAIPVVALALVIWAAASRSMGKGSRRVALAVGLLLSCAAVSALRTDGITGEGILQLKGRWTPTKEEQLLAVTPVAKVPAPAPVDVAKEAPKTGSKAEPATVAAAVGQTPGSAAEKQSVPEWPGFRGPNRDSVITGVKVKTDWVSAPPEEIWRKPVGPGWSSFAVHSGRFYTQEQRGEQEIVACYDLATGEPVWTHFHRARFYESNGGAGPRGTPAVHAGRVYALGATGVLNALDAASGTVVWTRNAAADTEAKLPGWGFTSSPIVVDDLLLVSLSGRMAAYRLSSGEKQWVVRTGGGSYSSPHLVTYGGTKQALLLNGKGVTAFSPRDGKEIWRHDWEGSAILQPVVLSDGGLLVATGDMMGGIGTRRLALKQEGDQWKAEEVWTSRGMKPYFNDLVVHEGYAYGFDGSILACIDLKDGARKWKGGRYGNGQMLLLKDQNLLLVLSEEGEVALVTASPGEYQEKARIRAVNGKTWNHPVVVGNVLLVRNGEEMVAYRLAPEGS